MDTFEDFAELVIEDEDDLDYILDDLGISQNVYWEDE